MRQQVISVTGPTDVSDPLVMNLNTNPFNVGFCVVVDGTINYTIQHCFDNIGSSLVTWFDHPTIASKSTNQDGNYAFPVSAIRIKANSGGGTATLTVIQAGIA